MSELDQKSFEFASRKRKKVANDDVVVIGSFDIAGGDAYRVRALTDTSVAHLIHKARSGDASTVLSAVMRFMEYALHPDDVQRFENDELDPVDGLELEEVVEVFEHVLSIVSAGPTSSQSGSSTASRRTGGSSKPTSRSKVSSTR